MAKKITLPDPLPYRESPNYSDRRHGIVPYLIIIHRPVGKYGPSIDWLRNPRSQVSAHIITEGNGTGVDVATQMVPWHKKAWAAAAFNSPGYQLEIDDDAWDGDDLGAFHTAARIAAFIGHKTGIPMTWSRKPLSQPGLIRHYDLGRAGGGHTDPTTDLAKWRYFLRRCQLERDRGGFRDKWGKGTFHRI
ncbi:MAG: N-acetylmuramoyl-L-alanine amidase [Actinomycetota bacterium]|nr:N-acetylmuramoyl-L-alanine amidase [Actinomycetota bacterium]